jgi:hypothetical protein
MQSDATFCRSAVVSTCVRHSLLSARIVTYRSWAVKAIAFARLQSEVCEFEQERSARLAFKCGVIRSSSIVHTAGSTYR